MKVFWNLIVLVYILSHSGKLTKSAPDTTILYIKMCATLIKKCASFKERFFTNFTNKPNKLYTNTNIRSLNKIYINFCKKYISLKSLVIYFRQTNIVDFSLRFKRFITFIACTPLRGSVNFKIGAL